MNNVAKSQPVSGSVVLSVLCIISVSVLIPMAVGGMISLIVALAGEDEYRDFESALKHETERIEGRLGQESIGDIF